jgi:putative hemolysin
MELIIIFILILLNGIFSMSEIALVSARKFKLESAAKKGNTNAKKALEFANNPNTFLSTVQIGITLIGILTGIYSGDKITDDIKNFFVTIPLLADYADSVSVIVVLIVLTFFSIVFGELIPKRIGMMFPETIAMLVARPMMVISIITKPFIWLLTKTNDLILGIFGVKDKGEGIVSEEEIKSIIQDSTASGEIQQIEQNIVERVFALGDRKVQEIMTHRSDLIWLDIDDDYDTVKQKAAAEIHSVYVVGNKSLDVLVGIVSVKTIFPLQVTNETFQLKNYVRQPVIVHENTPAYKVLEKFKEARFHYAVVVDEYGSLQGMVAMDDVVDALLGDNTEYDQDEYKIIQRDKNSWLADAQIPFYLFEEYFRLAGSNGSYNTLGGLILQQLNHIPTAGEKVRWKDFEFEILDMDNHIRIDKVMITRKND